MHLEIIAQDERNNKTIYWAPIRKNKEGNAQYIVSSVCLLVMQSFAFIEESKDVEIVIVKFTDNEVHAFKED